PSNRFLFSPAETNYPTHEQEILAIISCMKHWYPQLRGTHFTVLSDHAPLQYRKTQRDLSKQQIRWLDFLSNFDFDIKYILLLPTKQLTYNLVTLLLK